MSTFGSTQAAGGSSVLVILHRHGVCVYVGGGGGGDNPLGMYHYLKREGLEVLFLPDVVSN